MYIQVVGLGLVCEHAQGNVECWQGTLFHSRSLHALNLIPRLSLSLPLNFTLANVVHKNWRTGRAWKLCSTVAFPAIVGQEFTWEKGYRWAQFLTRLSLSFNLSCTIFSCMLQHQLRRYIVSILYRENPDTCANSRYNALIPSPVLIRAWVYTRPAQGYTPIVSPVLVLSVPKTQLIVNFGLSSCFLGSLTW